MRGGRGGRMLARQLNIFDAVLSPSIIAQEQTFESDSSSLTDVCTLTQQTDFCVLFGNMHKLLNFIWVHLSECRSLYAKVSLSHDKIKE